MSSIVGFVVKNSRVIRTLHCEVTRKIKSNVACDVVAKIVCVTAKHRFEFLARDIPECIFDLICRRQRSGEANRIEFDDGFRLEDWNGKRSVE